MKLIEDKYQMKASQSLFYWNNPCNNNAEIFHEAASSHNPCFIGIILAMKKNEKYNNKE